MPFDFSVYAEKCRYARDHGIENSFYTPFENMLTSIFPDTTHYHVFNNPASTKREGHPDFQGDRDGVPFMRVEAKPPQYPMLAWLNDPTVHPEAGRLSAQLHKYLRSVDMILLATDFRTIWWIDTQEMDADETKPIPILFTFRLLTNDLGLHPNLDADFARFKNLLYLDLETARTNVMDLLDHIMPYVKHLRDELTRIQKTPKGAEEVALQRHMREILSDFKKTLFKNYTEDFKKKFTDLYTQVVAYGIFMAWIRFNKGHRRTDEFTINTVSTYLPTGSLMQNLFAGIRDHITADLMASVFTPIEKWVNRTEYADIAVRIDDLMNEFYSGFLDKYDHETRKDMGVVYTPKDVVDFTINGIDHFLTNTFNMPKGILDPAIKYLDPSAGTMSYPCSLMESAYRKICKFVDADPESFHTDEEKRAKFSAWFREAYLRKDDRLSNVFGFEILMAPYVLGSLRVLMTAEKLGATVDYSHDKIQMYLMNTLMDYPENQTIDEYLLQLENPQFKSEIREGLSVRKKEDIMVLFTNPPYNVSSQNASQWITGLVDEYISDENLLREDGKPQIKKITGLKSSKDDYWKFLRFAQWKIAENGKRHGIVAFITNNFYIDGLCARGLRKEYRKAFDEIWIVDLHGDWKKAIPSRAEVTSDDNIFNVNCGVAIIFAIRYPMREHQRHKKDAPYACTVKYHELWGKSADKLVYLQTHSISEIPFTTVDEKLDWEFTPYVQTDTGYDNFLYLCDIFRKNIQGVVTAHDTLVSHVGQNELKDVITRFYNRLFHPHLVDHTFKDNAGKEQKGKKCKVDGIEFGDNRDWKIAEALTGSAESAHGKIMSWQWRGFDRRWVSYYQPMLNGGTDRFPVMQYLLPEQHNVALIAVRQSGKDLNTSYFISSDLVECKSMEGASGLANYIFPLKINMSTDPDDFDHPKSAIHSNLNPRFMSVLPYWIWTTLTDVEKITASEDVFYYIYGVLYSPTYRENYKGLLSKDFPRVPFPTSVDAFHAMSALGKRMAGIHLLTDPQTARFQRQITNVATASSVPYTYTDPTDDDDDHTTTVPTYKIGNYQWIPHPDNPELGDLWFDAKKKTKKAEDGTTTVTYQPNPTALHIDNVPKVVWGFEIGGIAQLDQWIGSRRYSVEPKKDHLTRGITQDELKYFLRVINAITDTLALLPSLDDAYVTVMADVASISMSDDDTETLV